MTADFHPTRKGGLRPNNPTKPRLRLTRGLVRQIPEHPIASDMFGNVSLAMDLNDQFGTCVPTGFDNLRRMVTVLLTGIEQDASKEDIVTWYRTQNPGFDPDLSADDPDQQDGGMVIQDFLSYLTKQGLIVGFAEIDPADDELLKAANYLAMGPYSGVELTNHQVSEQFDEGTWDEVGGYAVGGHCIPSGAYSGAELAEEDCATWQQRIHMTAEFLDRRRSEAWAVIFPDHLTHPGFRKSVDLAAFATAWTEITGRPFPVTVDPDPEPTPTPEPPVPGGVGWFQVDPGLVAPLGRAAAHHHRTPTEELNHALRRYLHR